jgi:hypothetical protein
MIDLARLLRGGYALCAEDAEATGEDDEEPEGAKPHDEFSNLPVCSSTVSRGVHSALTQDTPPPLFRQSVTHHPLYLVQAHAI